MAVSIMDIADDDGTTVDIRGVLVPIVGLSGRDIARVLGRFKDLQKIMDGAPVTLETIAEMAPEAIGVIGAMGTRRPGIKEVEDKMQSLKVADQIKILKAIARETLGEYHDPLAEAVGSRFGGGETARGDTGRAPALRLRLPSKDSLRSATTPEMFGATHPGNSQDSPS